MRREDPPSTGRTGVTAPATTGAAPHSALAFPAAALTGVLTVLAFPLYGHDMLVWVALVPLLWAATGAGLRRGFLLGWTAGLTLVAGGFLWVLYSIQAFTDLGKASSLLFWPWVLFEALPWGLLGLILGALGPAGRAAPGAVVLALFLWVGIEHYFPHIFPWHLGGALWSRSRLLQCADLLGVSGLTALVFLVNVVVYQAALCLRGRRAFPVVALPLAVLLLAGALLYGELRLRRVDRELAGAPSLKAGVVQPVAAPRDRWEEPVDFFLKMETLTRALTQKQKLDLVVWPEGADSVGYLLEPDGRRTRKGFDRNRPLHFQNLDVPLVAGTHSVSRLTEKGRNTAEFVLPGVFPPAGFYDKQVRLLFGEYVPGLELLPEALQEMVPHVGTIEAGRDSPLFKLPTGGAAHGFRILICYEAILPALVRESARDADFLVNVTEDRWYGQTAHVEQHLSVLVLRAVENRLPIVRAANAGPSGVIDAAGRTTHLTRAFEKTEAAFRLEARRLWTVYSAGGYGFPAGCLLVGAVGLAVRVALSRRRAPGEP